MSHFLLFTNKNYFKHWYGHKSNDLSQEATFETICHIFDNKNLNIVMDKNPMNSDKRQRSKPSVTLLTDIQTAQPTQNITNTMM